MSSGNRRADGRLRPCRVRYQRRKRGGPFVDPANEAEFRTLALGGTIIWNGRQLQEQAGVDKAVLAGVLDDLADRAGWEKLSDTVGDVQAIAMPRSHPRRRTAKLGEHRDLMRRLVIEVALRLREDS